MSKASINKMKDLTDPLNELFADPLDFRRQYYLVETRQWAKLLEVLANHRNQINKLKETTK